LQKLDTVIISASKTSLTRSLRAEAAAAKKQTIKRKRYSFGSDRFLMQIKSQKTSET